MIAVLAIALLVGCSSNNSEQDAAGAGGWLAESLRQSSTDYPRPLATVPLLTSSTPYPDLVNEVVPYPSPVGSTPSLLVRIRFPVIVQSSRLTAEDGLASATTTVTPTAIMTPLNTPTPSATRRPLRPTKLGIGVYASGGSMESPMYTSRPSVILLMDPTIDFAKTVRSFFPGAFIVGRKFVAHQPLDNPAERGRAFADDVAKEAVPLQGVVDAWMSYNEVTDNQRKESYVAYNVFQAAFARRLQGDYGISAVAGNGASATVAVGDYATYFAEAISASDYFGLHAYSPVEARSFREPAAQELMLRYRRIKVELDRAGVRHGPFVVTEVGLWDGFRGMASETEMVDDFVWLAEEMNKDAYVKGFMVFGLFNHGNERWYGFNINTAVILEGIGEYNTEPLLDIGLPVADE